MLVLGHDHGNMAVGSIVLSVVPIGKLIGTRKSEFAGTPPLPKRPRYGWKALSKGFRSVYRFAILRRSVSLEFGTEVRARRLADFKKVVF